MERENISSNLEYFILDIDVVPLAYAKVRQIKNFQVDTTYSFNKLHFRSIEFR